MGAARSRGPGHVEHVQGVGPVPAPPIVPAAPADAPPFPAVAPSPPAPPTGPAGAPPAAPYSVTYRGSPSSHPTITATLNNLATARTALVAPNARSVRTCRRDVRARRPIPG